MGTLLSAQFFCKPKIALKNKDAAQGRHGSSTSAGPQALFMLLLCHPQRPSSIQRCRMALLSGWGGDGAGQGKARCASLRAQPRGRPCTHIPLAPPRCKGVWEMYLQLSEILSLCTNKKTGIADKKQMLLQVEIKWG